MSDSKRTLAGGRYRLTRCLGKGGQATVWRATDQLLRVDRAIKILTPRPSVDGRHRARLLDEARAMARTAHPNVVQVLDIGMEKGQDYLVMELAPGGALREGRPLDEIEAVDVGVQVLAALAAAHQAGIVHRDVKPSNVLRFANGRVKLADFGIAMIQQPSVQRQVDLVLGSPSYCAPEQLVDADSADGRADLYAVGATLYAMLTGGNARKLRLAGLSSPVWQQLPASLRRPLQRATAMAVALRQDSAEEMAQDLLDAVELPGARRAVLEAAFPGGRAVPETPAVGARLLEPSMTFQWPDDPANADGSARLLVVSGGALFEDLAASLPDGLQLRAVRTAADALAEVAERPPDVVVLDLHLADGDGRMLLEQLRGSPSCRGVPIVVFGPGVTPEIRSELYASGADEVVSITSARAVGDVVSDYLARGRAHAAGVDRRAFRGALNDSRQRYLIQGAHYSVAIIVSHPRPGQVEAVRRQAAVALSDGAVVHRWAEDAVAVLLPGLDMGGGELYTNLLLRGLEVAPDAAAGVVAPRDAPLQDALVQAEHLARLAWRAGSGMVAATSLEPPPTPRIAMADDDADIVSLVSAVLGRSGTTVIPFASGDALLASAADLADVSLILLDVHMPGRDGYETLAAVRADPHLAEIPVVMLTSVDSDDQILRGFTLGADDWVAKPFSPPLLEARVRRLLRRPR